MSEKLSWIVWILSSVVIVVVGILSFPHFDAQRFKTKTQPVIDRNGTKITVSSGSDFTLEADGPDEFFILISGKDESLRSVEEPKPWFGYENDRYFYLAPVDVGAGDKVVIKFFGGVIVNFHLTAKEGSEIELFYTSMGKGSLIVLFIVVILVLSFVLLIVTAFLCDEHAEWELTRLRRWLRNRREERGKKEKRKRGATS